MYHSIAVATTFSPRFLALLSEAGRVSEHFAAPLRLIHAGEETEAKRAQFQKGLEDAALPPGTLIHWVPGDPSVTIPSAARENGVDLLVAGAIDKDTDPGLRPFANDIARVLLRNSPADLFLFLRPKAESNPVRCPAVLIDFSRTSAILLRKTVKLAARQGCEKVHAIHIRTAFDERRWKLAGKNQDAGEELDQFVLDSTPLDVPVETKCIRGNTGFAACEFIQSIEADLLAVPTGMPGGEAPVLSSNLNWLYQVIPCNLWVMREKGVKAEK